MEAIDYNNNTYCSKCELKRPKDTVHCPDCGRGVRHRPKYTHNKGKWVDIFDRMRY